MILRNVTLPMSSDFAVLRALALQIRIATVDQVARGWFAHSADPSHDAARCLANLEQQKLVTRRLLESHPMLPLACPVFAWQPGQPDPSRDQMLVLAEQLKTRWSEPDVAVETDCAAPRASRLFGAFVDARHLKHCEVTHDLHVTEVFLRYCSSNKSCHQWWWGEAAFPKLGKLIRFTKDPDAYLLNSNGNARRIIEFAGTYDAEHLSRFHEHCSYRAAEAVAEHLNIDESSALTNLYSPGGTAYDIW